MRRLVWALLIGLSVSAATGCKENVEATKACRGKVYTSAACEECCRSQGVNGYKFMGGNCSCLGD